MRLYEATYSMGCIATGGYFKSLVVADQTGDVKRVLNETHDEDVSNLHVAAGESTEHTYEQVLTTDYA